jgi:hypothetical protein
VGRVRASAEESDASPSRLTYREDDAHFKRRLDSAVQSYWVYNSAATILVCVAIFYVLGQPIYIGIITGLLILLVSNLYQTMNRINQTHRWEIYTDRVVIPASGFGKKRTLAFSTIESMTRERGFLGGRLVVVLKGGKHVGFYLQGQERIMQTLEKTYSQYSAARSADVVPPEDARAPVPIRVR